MEKYTIFDKQMNFVIYKSKVIPWFTFPSGFAPPLIFGGRFRHHATYFGTHFVFVALGKPLKASQDIKD